ncbi:unnamed protein product [Rotaria sordida]|uniref:Uncharacterized protein n=2 Tax=Rotaria sordida TaxID=392033 RepID=A0A815TBJ5_9BILA|nr:unnamed protein product [Rotaria sordida]CAF1505962.1 unnamed protein product [Rotaria sordida]
MNFLVNALERRVGFDINGDGYLGGGGFLRRLKHALRFIAKHHNIIGHYLDNYYGYYSPYNIDYNSFPPMSYGGYPSTDFGHGSHFGY